jgi:hypothetical protein
MAEIFHKTQAHKRGEIMRELVDRNQKKQDRKNENEQDRKNNERFRQAYPDGEVDNQRDY